MSIPVQCQVEGMTCGNCALTIQKYLSKQGATHVVANAATGEVAFQVAEEKNIDQLFDGIDSLGYHVQRAKDGEGSNSSSVKPLLLISFLLWLPLISHMFISWEPLHLPWVQFLLALPVYVIGVYHFGRSAVRSIINKIPNMDVLVFLGSTAAFVYSCMGWWLHPEAVHDYLFFETASSIITLVLAGNYLEEYTVRSTAGAMKELMKYQKTKTTIVWTDSIGNETLQEIENEFVRVDDVLQVNAGDKIPSDGKLISGTALVDESMMTGESAPVLKEVGSDVTGGTIVVQGNLRMKASAVGNNTALATIIKLVNEAQAAKPPMQKLADRISAIFVPVVIVIAILTFIMNAFVFHQPISNSMMRMIAVMVIACPCAMGLATPAAIMVGLGRAARNGILIKGGDTLERFKTIQQIVFDKTGTLTTGNLTIDCFETTMKHDEFKSIVNTLESHSSHPIAKSICSAWANFRTEFTAVEEIKGIGIQAHDLEGHQWELGSYRLAELSKDQTRHDLYLLKNGQLQGWIDMKDELRLGTQEAIKALKQKGYKTILLSGDRNEKCVLIANELGIDEVYSEQLPQDKLKVLDELMKIAPTAMVGDGINDAPSLAKASIGISLSGATQIAIQSAQVILLKNNLSSLSAAIQLGKSTFTTIRENLFWAFFYNIAAIPVAASGYLTPTWGAALMGLSDIVLLLNSLRLRYRKLN